MILGQKREGGQRIEQLKIGDSLKISKNIEDKDILIYLGLTGDANPAYIQHNYMQQTEYQKPIVPHVMLIGMVYTSVNGHLPGPGSVIKASDFQFPYVLYHYAHVDISLEVTEVMVEKNEVKLTVQIKDEEQRNVLEGSVTVLPPLPLKPLHANAFENF